MWQSGNCVTPPCHDWEYCTVDPARRGETMNTTTDTTHEEISDVEIDAAVTRILADAGTSLDELRASASRGRFESEQQRRAWFVISGLGRS